MASLTLAIKNGNYGTEYEGNQQNQLNKHKEILFKLLI